jgi:hypothetical protein
VITFSPGQVIVRSDAASPQSSRPLATHLQVFALLYFAAMLGRLFVQLSRGAADVLAAGGIPIMFHWVLALFLLLLSRPAAVQMNKVDR